MRRFFLPVLFLLLLYSIIDSCEENTFPKEPEASNDPAEIVSTGPGSTLDSFLIQMTGEGYSGSVLVAKDDVILLRKGYGLANRELGIPSQVGTIFNVCSISKTFTAAAILKLEEEGKLRTDDPISKYLGSFPGEKEKATIHHLLIHTAGLVKRGTELEYGDRESFVQSMKDSPMESPPGEAFRYTNAGYTLLAAIVEEVSGMPFEDYVYRKILEPAGMTSTALIWDARFDHAPLAIGYGGKSVNQLTAVPRTANTWGERGPGSFGSTVDDLHRWIKALQSDSVLSEASRKKMFTAYYLDDGYGWNINETEYGLRIDKGCGLPEFESQVAWYPDQDVIITFTINNHIGFRVPVWEGIETRVLSNLR